MIGLIFSAEKFQIGAGLSGYVADIGASFLCADLGIVPEMEPRPDHASYVESWLRVLEGDRKAIFQAAAYGRGAPTWGGSATVDDIAWPRKSQYMTDLDKAKDVLIILIGIFGTIVGFYFGSAEHNKPTDDANKQNQMTNQGQGQNQTPSANGAQPQVPPQKPPQPPAGDDAKPPPKKPEPPAGPP